MARMEGCSMMLVPTEAAAAAALAAASSARARVGRFTTRRQGALLRVQLPLGFREPNSVGEQRRRSQALVTCSSSSSKGYSNGEDENQDYLLAHVVDAVSMLPLHGRLYMTLANGREVEVDHVNPTKGRLLYRARNPAIFLKVVHDSDVLLPIIVGETAVAMLMKALHDEEKSGRPNHYQLLKQIVGALEYEARMVKITERVKDTYYARIYFGQEGEKELSSVDARPSDAINFAVRCKVPIYVNRAIIDSDAVRPVYTTAENWDSTGRNQRTSYLDSPNVGPDPIAEEITLMKDMLMAVVEERYSDAARCRDQLHKLRISLRGQMEQSY